MSGLLDADVLGTSLYEVAWSFVLYSVVGVLVETVFVLVVERVLESRSGLLYLPLRPLYGVGGCAFVLLLPAVADQPVAVFVLGAAVATVVEYGASLLSERSFGAVSWDYAHRPLNLHGRVCLAYSLAWGGLALGAVYVLDPAARALLRRVPVEVGQGVLALLAVLVLASSLLTVAVLVRTRRRVTALRGGAPDRGPLSTRRSRVLDVLVPDRVLIDTFPRLTLVLELLELTGQTRTWLVLARR